MQSVVFIPNQKRMVIPCRRQPKTILDAMSLRPSPWLQLRMRGRKSELLKRIRLNTPVRDVEAMGPAVDLVSSPDPVLDLVGVREGLLWNA